MKNYLKVNDNEYFFGLLCSKISLFNLNTDYEIFKQMNNHDIIEYLYNQKQIEKDKLLIGEVINQLSEGLEKEIMDYLEEDNLIYRYFFKVNYDLRIINNIYDELSNNLSIKKIISKYHGISNIILLFRALDLNKTFEETKESLLLQDEYSIEIIENVYSQGKNEVIKFINEIYGIKINFEIDTIGIEKEVMNYFYKYIETFSYSQSVIEVLIYYIFIRKKYIANISSILYIGDIYYEWTNIYK